MSEEYLVPSKRVRVEYERCRSRFISTIFPVTSPDNFRSILREIRDEMPEASHHVYAWIVGHGESVIEGMSDDGEPSGTSGPPALAVLRGSGLGNVGLTITRYFGGTKLGTGGLVSAYKAAAKLAVESVPKEVFLSRITCELTIDYHHYDRVIEAILESGGLIDHENFSENVSVVTSIPRQQFAAIQVFIRDVTKGEKIIHPISD